VTVGKPLNIEMGALAPRLQDQLKGLVAEIELVHFDKDADAITRLLIRDMITETTAWRARQKLMRQITKKLL
jgi:hypothetical protein